MSEPARLSFPAASGDPGADVFLYRAAGLAPVVVCLFGVSLSPALGGEAGVFSFPRMTGKPSLPLPMMTTFAFVDWESWSVASMPRQRRYESEMPWLTIC